MMEGPCVGLGFDERCATFLLRTISKFQSAHSRKCFAQRCDGPVAQAAVRFEPTATERVGRVLSLPTLKYSRAYYCGKSDLRIAARVRCPGGRRERHAQEVHDIERAVAQHLAERLTRLHPVEVIVALDVAMKVLKRLRRVHTARNRLNSRQRVDLRIDIA